MTEEKNVPPIPSVGADEGQPSKTYTPLVAEHQTDYALIYRQTLPRDDWDDVFGGGTLPSHRRAEKKRTPKIGTCLYLSYYAKYKSCKLGVNSVITTQRKKPAIVIPADQQWTDLGQMSKNCLL